MRIFDTFPFDGELDLLTHHLAEVHHLVDVFVIVEAGQTYQGEAKPCTFAAHRDRSAIRGQTDRGAIAYPAFYSYAYPSPPGFADAKVAPAAAFYSQDFGEFILPYDAVRTSSDPDATLMAFLQSTYDAAADLGRWDRAALERPRDFVRPDGRAG